MSYLPPSPISFSIAPTSESIETSSYSRNSQDVLSYDGEIDPTPQTTLPPINITIPTEIDDQTYNTQPDEDAIKLFVGQVPRHMNENDLLPIMEEYGEIYDIVVIRDKITGVHRGCAFVTYRTKEAAELAIEKLHNHLVLPHSTNPLQVRPAEGQVGITPVQEHKLFIGMIPRQSDDKEIRSVFEPYGAIEEVYILRHPVTGQSKGCAFLKFKEKNAALQAINEINGQLIMEGGTSPLVVKFADSRKQRIQRAKQQAAETRAMQNVAYYSMPYQSPYFSGGNSIPGGFVYYSPYMYTPTPNPVPPPMSPVMTSVPTMMSPTAAAMFQTDTTVIPSVSSPVPPLSSKPSRLSSQLEGPLGANLFIYHLPHDITDADLATAFAPYGMVLSAKVYMDKNTGESKGFGFVSYNTPEEASLAIERMNGFQIGSKRLKVQHKRIHMLNEEDEDYAELQHTSSNGSSINGEAEGEEDQEQVFFTKRMDGLRLS